ncbi:MAG TPA: type II toxin-antitoxin system prevent-host-death family antitoxin [Chloroflexota bacterium]|nr:type II toxin-antitoxin system prevent-host-death family antitoxin [Chloroflexota bacterium]
MAATYPRVGIRELRQNLSVYVRRVKAGETLEVTDQNQPVALLTPLPKQSGSALDRLYAEGRLLNLPTLDLTKLPPPGTLPPGSMTLAEALEEQKEERL